MDAPLNVDELPNSDAFLPRSDNLSVSGVKLLDSDRFLEGESDEDDAELLNCSSWAKRESEIPDISQNHFDFRISVSSDKISSPSDSAERYSQVDMNVETETLALVSQPESSKLSTLGVGLSNLGNTCFLNAVLQCFLHTVPLLQSILSDSHAAVCQCSQESFCPLCALRELVERALTFSNTIQPWKIVNNLSYFSTNFQRFQQEDAHEFFQCVLSKLEICHELKQKDCEDSNRINFVKQVFGGCLVSKLKCCNCGNCSDTYEPSVDLSLEIDKADDLLTALQSFTKVEMIEDPENMFTCETCKKQVNIEKQLAFSQTPSVATFHLKRFKNDGCFVEKIDKHVEFPLELDVLPFTCGQPKYDEIKYKLYAVVVHMGLSSTSGHYYCFIRLSPGVWCKFDDSNVVQVHEDFVLSQEAYILFYAKESTSWFSTFVETEMCTTFNILSTSPKSVLDEVSTLASSPPQRCNDFDANEASDATGSNCRNAENKENELSCNESVSNCFNLLSQEPRKGVSPCPPKKVSPIQEVDDALVNIKTISPQTPPRSPSEDEIYRDDPPDVISSIQHSHVRSVDLIPSKRRLEKDLDDLETRQACSLIKKSIPGARGKQLLAALKGSKSEEVPSRSKKSRSSGSPGKHDGNGSSSYHSPNMRSVMRPLLAGGFR